VNIEAIRAMHQDYIKYECGIHGGTGANLLYCDGTHAGHNEFAGWVIDGFSNLLDELATTQAENNALRNELCVKCGRYSEEHFGACNGCKWAIKEVTP